MGEGTAQQLRRRCCAAATGICATLLAFTGTAAGAPTWSAPRSVTQGDTEVAGAPAAAYGDSGRLTLAWTSGGEGPTTLPMAQRPLGGPFAASPALATGTGAAEPALARGPGGELYAAWVISEGGGLVVMATRVLPDGNVVSAQRLSALGANSSEPALAVGSDGRVAVAWTTFDPEGNGQILAVHGTLGAPLTPRIASVGDTTASDPDVAFGVGGALHVAWTRLDSEGDGRIKAAAELVDETFGPSRAISPAGPNATEPALAPVPGGGLAFAWTEGPEEEGVVRLGIEPAPAQPITTRTVAGGGFSAGARLDIDPTSGLYLAWIRTMGGQSDVLVSARNGAGELDAPTVLSGGDAAIELDLAFSPQGDAVVSWRRNLGTEENPAGDLRAAVYDAPRPGQPSAPPPAPVAALPALGLTSA